jgi:hypothetical protein
MELEGNRNISRRLNKPIRSAPSESRRTRGLHRMRTSTIREGEPHRRLTTLMVGRLLRANANVKMIGTGT